MKHRLKNELGGFKNIWVRKDAFLTVGNNNFIISLKTAQLHKMKFAQLCFTTFAILAAFV